MDPTLKSWIFDHPDVVAIEYHVPFPYAGDPFFLENQDENLARRSFYGVGSAPSIRVAGRTASTSGYPSVYASEVAVPAPVTLALSGSVNETDGAGTVNVRIGVETPIEGDVRVMLALTESDIHQAFPNGIDVHHHVFRRFHPSADGVSVSLARMAGDVVDVPIAVDAEDGWDLANVDVVVFVQDAATRTVYQAATEQLLMLPPATPVSTVSWSGIKSVYAD